MSGDVVGYIIGAAGVSFGAFTYFTSGILADKKQAIINTVRLDNLEKQISKLEEKLDDIKDEVKGDITIIEERLNSKTG